MNVNEELILMIAELIYYMSIFISLVIVIVIGLMTVSFMIFAIRVIVNQIIALATNKPIVEILEPEELPEDIREFVDLEKIKN